MRRNCRGHFENRQNSLSSLLGIYGDENAMKEFYGKWAIESFHMENFVRDLNENDVINEGII